ncbi:MAG: hypothetical protein K8J31_25580, partial [Anaerolineae bacterium]|nr:hypothetical protein [Anaerolineae bacterium]
MDGKWREAKKEIMGREQFHPLNFISLPENNTSGGIIVKFCPNPASLQSPFLMGAFGIRGWIRFLPPGVQNSRL